MKCLIDGKEVNAKTISNYGYCHSSGCYSKNVEYKGKEYVVVKIGKIWRPITVEEKFRPSQNYIGKGGF